MEPCTFTFPHERLDAYAAAVELARRVRRLRWPARSASIRDQAVRASASVVLNIAEGVGRGPGDARKNFHRIALGSVAEVHAVMAVVDVNERDAYELDQLLRRLGAMLTAMTR